MKLKVLGVNVFLEFFEYFASKMAKMCVFVVFENTATYIMPKFDLNIGFRKTPIFPEKRA
jgi:hypothetical protein